MPSVVAAEPADVTKLSAMLARAFATDPISTAILPSDARRVEVLRRFFALQLRHSYLPRGQVLTVEDRSAAALTMGPRLGPMAVADRMAAVSLLPMLGRRLLVTRRVARQLEALHPRAPHCYLGTLGTEPSRQGSGLGTALVTAVLERCDQQRVFCYLESSKEENIAFYERFGFHVTAEVDLGLGGVRTWLMRREAPQLRT